MQVYLFKQQNLIQVLATLKKLPFFLRKAVKYVIPDWLM